MSLQTAIDSLRQLIENPASNIVAASLALAIVVIVVLVLAVVVLITVMPRAGDRTRKVDIQPSVPDGGDTGVSATPKVTLLSELRRRRWVIVVALGLVAGVATYTSSGTAGYCAGTCHSMVEAGESWRSSTHATTPCIDCHERSIPDGITTRTRHVVAQLRGIEGTPRRTVSSQRCLSCHPDIRTGARRSGRGLVVDHSHIIAAGMDCMRCHQQTGHRPTPFSRSGTMNECLSCHDGEQALNACFVCHEDEPVEAALAARTFPTVKLPPPDCTDCHRTEKP